MHLIKLEANYFHCKIIYQLILKIVTRKQWSDLCAIMHFAEVNQPVIILTQQLNIL